MIYPSLPPRPRRQDRRCGDARADRGRGRRVSEHNTRHRAATPEGTVTLVRFTMTISAVHGLCYRDRAGGQCAVASMSVRAPWRSRSEPTKNPRACGSCATPQWWESSHWEPSGENTVPCSESRPVASVAA